MDELSPLVVTALAGRAGGVASRVAVFVASCCTRRGLVSLRTCSKAKRRANLGGVGLKVEVHEKRMAAQQPDAADSALGAAGL